MQEVLNQESIKREIEAKMKGKIKLSSKERAYYLLFMATSGEVKEFIKEENSKYD